MSSGLAPGGQADGDDEGGGLAGDVQAQGAAQGLDAADDAAGGVGEDDGVHAGDVDALGDQACVDGSLVVVADRAASGGSVRSGGTGVGRGRGWGLPFRRLPRMNVGPIAPAVAEKEVSASRSR